jgi:acetyltransferase-like isoleucine patch superfamily enzyme
MIIRAGDNIIVTEDILVSGNVRIGHCSIVGDVELPSRVVRLGSNARIGRFCLIEGGVSIGDNFELDDYCAVYSGSALGNNVKLLYGKRVYGGAVIGDNCIIGGNVPERCKLANNVTFMGEVAHSHYDPKRDWDNTDEPSPSVGEGTIVGVNALLVGGITIGRNCYVSAGEILRHDLPDNMVYIKGEIYPLDFFKGMIKTRAS